MSEQTITDNISKLLERVRLAAQKSQFPNKGIQIVAVSKTRPSEAIRMACKSGLTNFGENYLQEAVGKIGELDDLDLTWHFIGPIQSNKTRLIAENFHWVHSIDRSKVARRLSEQRPEHLPPMQACIQVNISDEASKSGVSLDALPALAQEIVTLPRLELRGLMAVPQATADINQQRESFSRLRRALERLQGLSPHLDTLSMGMSADLESAIAEGSTLIRIGTDIFGPRNG